MTKREYMRLYMADRRRVRAYLGVCVDCGAPDRKDDGEALRRDPSEGGGRMMADQPTLFPLPEPEPVPTEVLMRRLDEMERELRLLDGGSHAMQRASSGNAKAYRASVHQTVENLKAQLRERGHQL
jgi:hypothetical protein